MRKVVKLACCLLAVFVLFFFGTLWADKLSLQNNIIRMHVVANSNSNYDQNVKMVVKDAVLDYLQVHMNTVENVDEAVEYLNTHLGDIADVVRSTLVSAHEDQKISVSLVKEAFPRRDYEFVSLPTGIYHALQVKIGDAEGENWWCVVFPSLCMPSHSASFTEMAVMAGVEENLAAGLAGDKHYEVRFYLLDCLGKLENALFGK